MNKRIVILGIISALLASGCGRSGPTEVARPILMGKKSGAVTRPTSPNLTAPAAIAPAETPAPVLDESYDDMDDETATLPETGATTVTDVVEDVVDDVLDTVLPTPTPVPTATPTPTPTPTPPPAPQLGNDYVKEIGKGSLNSAHGLAIADGQLFVVDNQRTGLLGSYSAVRVYDIASGAYTKLSFENIGWVGAKNMPSTVTKVKLEGASVLAADAAKTYVFGVDAKLSEERATTFAMTTQATDPLTGDVYRLQGETVERVHNGSVVATFGGDVIGDAVSIAVSADGEVFVTDTAKAVIHHFGAGK